MREQGWSEELIRSGFYAVAPDGTKVTWHNTPSDHRADANAIAHMKRLGFEWPFDKKAFRAKKRRERKKREAGGEDK